MQTGQGVWPKATRCVRPIVLVAALAVSGCNRSASEAVTLPAAQPAAPTATPLMPEVVVQRGPFQLAAACGGRCPVGLSALAGERALAVWADREGAWAQRFDLARGSSLGVPLALGELDESNQPYVFGLPDGDAALFGMLRDGRITFARGSEVPARRVAPKVVVPRGSRGVQSLAASATNNGLALLLLRDLEPKDRYGNHAPNDAELHWFDANGKQLRAPLLWKVPFGIQARLAACGDHLYLAWSVVGGVLVTRMSSSGERRAETLLPPQEANYDALVGPLLCTPTGARLLSGWEKSDEFKPEAKVSLANINATEALPGQGRWTTLPLPGEPQLLTLKEYPFGAYASTAGLKVLVKKDGQQVFVGLDPAAGKVEALPGAPTLPPHTPCIPTSDGRRALCVASEGSQPKPECKAYVHRLTASFIGDASAAQPSMSSPAPAPFFDVRAAAVPDPRARSDAQEKERRSWLRCGEAGWEGLRSAIQSFCDQLRKQHRAAKKKSEKQELEDELKGYCGEGPDSLLFEATYCTDEPLVCGNPGVSSILSVERAEFEQGSEHLGMKVGHCDLYFSGKGDTWRVVNEECGD